MKKLSFLVLLLNIFVYPQFTTPGTGVNWTPDSLRVYAPAIVTGEFPNYAIINKIIVAANDKVTVLPGTTITFTGSTSGFEVNGSLSVSGAPGNIITLTASTPDSAGTNFDGLRFNATAVDSLCLVKYAKIQYAYAGVRCVDASITVENSEFYKCARGLQLSASNTIFKNNTIRRCYEYGITMTLGSNPWIEGNIIAENNTQNTSAKNQISVGLQGNNSPVIKNNLIYNASSTKSGGVSIWVSGSTSFSNAVIEGNTIYGNSFGMTLYSSGSGIVNVRVANNTIYNNNINPDPSVSGSGINVNGSPFNKPVITRNIIYGNHWGVTIQNGTSIQAGPEPNLGNLTNQDTTDDGLNKIYNNLQSGSPFDLFNNCTNNVYAQNNDWGVYDSAAIELRITHKVDDPLKGSVFYMPFYNSGVIPVELNSFTGTSLGEGIELRWETATETNNLGFVLERRGAADNPELWHQLTFIPGKGTSTVAMTYTYTDKAVTNISGLHNYRLIQIDLDGSRNILSEIAVQVSGKISDALKISLFPNPSKENINIAVSGLRSGEVTIELYNLSGERLYSRIVETGNRNSGNIRLSVDELDLPSGSYFVRVSEAGRITTGKFEILK